MDFDPENIPTGLYANICSIEDVMELARLKAKWSDNPDVILAIDSRIANIKHRGLR